MLIGELTDREEEILWLLARLRFLTAPQLAEFVFARSAVTIPSRLAMTQRLLAGLRRRGLVAMRPRVIGGPEFGEGRPTYHLSADGARLGRTSWPGMPVRRLRSSGAFLGRHALTCAKVILAFQRSASVAVDHELVSWECDWQAALPLGPSVLEPDAYLLYRAQEQRLHAFVEVDMGSEYGRFVSAKMRRYLELHRAGTWRDRVPVWPVILFVAQTEARLVQLRRLAESVSRLPDGQWSIAASFHFATLDSATRHRATLDRIWQVVGSVERQALIADRTLEGPTAA